MTIGNAISLIKMAWMAFVVFAVWKWFAWAAAFDRLKAEYIADSQAAAVMEQARLTRVKAEQQGITDNVAHDYNARLADLRARYERLQASRRSAQSQPVPGLSPASVTVVAASDDQGFSLDKRLVASQQAEQLDALITFVERQAAVDPNH